MATRGKDIRLFLGIKVSMATSRALAEAAESMRRAAYDGGYQVRWVKPTNYHLTLQFLGWCQPEIVTAIRDALTPELAALPQFEFTAAGVGAFPKPESARVLWARVHEPTGQLATLAGRIADRMEALGFAKEKRPYHPHITLGRVKRVDDLSPVLTRASERNFSETFVKRVILFESKMKSSGSEYLETHSWRLARAKKDEKRQTGPVEPSPRGPSAHAEPTAQADRSSQAGPAQPVEMETTPQPAVQGSDAGTPSDDGPATTEE